MFAARPAAAPDHVIRVAPDMQTRSKEQAFEGIRTVWPLRQLGAPTTCSYEPLRAETEWTPSYEN